MLPKNLKTRIKKDDKKISSQKHKNGFKIQPFNPLTYYKDITNSLYIDGLIILRHYIKEATDWYFSEVCGAKNVDLFILTSSISSPIGPGSNSNAIEFQFGRLKTFLVDSAQFGFEPLLFNIHDKLYCYLPSLRGEDPDERHLNQFFHCELEMRGMIYDLIPIIEGYVKSLAETILTSKEILTQLSLDYKQSFNALNKLLQQHTFPTLYFDEVCKKLKKENNSEELIQETIHGRDITSKGEQKIFSIYNIDTPIWIKEYDRKRVPFYQKPQTNNTVINADLLFPPLIKGAFGGEVVGAGQRQDNTKEMYESLKQQGNISPTQYEWYIDLRNDKRYKITSGFGLGIERFLTWALCRNNIRDVSIYPRLKNIKMNP